MEDQREDIPVLPPLKPSFAEPCPAVVNRGLQRFSPFESRTVRGSRHTARSSGASRTAQSGSSRVRAWLTPRAPTLAGALCWGARARRTPHPARLRVRTPARCAPSTDCQTLGPATCRPRARRRAQHARKHAWASSSLRREACVARLDVRSSCARWRHILRPRGRRKLTSSTSPRAGMP